MKISRRRSNVAGAATKTPREGVIGAHDWVRAGLAMLANEGIEAVRVEPLAVRLGVTKGSFYWHFKDRAALHRAMLDAWRRNATHGIIEAVEAKHTAPLDRLRHLIRIATSDPKAAGLETALRAWARTDAEVGEVVAGIDSERQAYVTNLLAAIGIERGLAEVRARIVYLALIGSYFRATSTSFGADRALWNEVAELVACHTGERNV